MNLNELSKGELAEMVQSLESQLRDLYLEKRLSGLSREQLVEMIGKLEQEHDEMISNLTAQLCDLYAEREHKSSGSSPASGAGH